MVVHRPPRRLPSKEIKHSRGYILANCRGGSPRGYIVAAKYYGGGSIRGYVE